MSRTAPLIALLGLVLVACDTAAMDAATSPSPAIASAAPGPGTIATPSAAATPVQTPMPLFGEPVAIGGTCVPA